MAVFTLTRVDLAVQSAEQFHPQSCENEKEEKKQQAQIAHLGERLHHRVQQGSDPFGHLQQLEDSSDPHHPHYPQNGGVDRDYVRLEFLQNDPHHRQLDDDDVEDVPLVFDVEEETQRYDFHRALEDKHRREEVIEDFQDVREDVWHLVALYGHGDHVQADHGGYGEVEVLRRDHVVDEEPPGGVVDVVGRLVHLYNSTIIRSEI